MQCYQPIRLTYANHFYKYKNKYVPDYNSLHVGCGKCLACLSQKAREWTMRLTHEWKYYDESNSMFLTLTYDKENIPNNYSLSKRDLQLFWKRVRKRLYKENIKIKVFNAGEYGFRRGRPHYHCIVFGIPNLSAKIRDLNHYSASYKMQGKFKFNKYDRMLYDCWKKGNIRIGYVSQTSIQYCSLYTLKGNHTTLSQKDYFKQYGRIKPFRTMSKGIGKRYVLENKLNLLQNLKIHWNGIDCSIPRSYLKWMYKLGFDIADAIKEKSLENKALEIHRAYKKFGIPELTWNDFYKFEDYFDISNHKLLYKLVESELINKRLKYESRHDKYLNEKLSKVLSEEAIA